MKTEIILYAFCYKQDKFIDFLEKFKIIKPISVMNMVHPITDKAEAYAEKCYIWKGIARLVEKMNYWFLDSYGEEAIERLCQCGVLKRI